jgi:hypothetical protein
MNDPLQLDVSPGDYQRLGIAAPQQSEAEWYASMHRVCPQCGGVDIETTCIGMIYAPGVKHMQDTNRAACHCGWRGIVHDLLPEIEQ